MPSPEEQLETNVSSSTSEDTESSSPVPVKKESEEEGYLQLPRCEGMLHVGSAIVYKLLEIDLNLTPVVSE
jgi:hypothetical protein